MTRVGSFRTFAQSSHSATPASADIPTPGSSSFPTPSSALSQTPSHSSRSVIRNEPSSPDRVIASIEPGSDEEVTENSATSSSMRVLTPSVSLTPPPNGNPQGSSTGNTASHEGDSLVSMNSRLERMRLSSQGSSIGMSEIANAIDHVAQGHDSRANTLLEARASDSPSPSPSQRSSYRRRSSSRVNTEEAHNVKDERPPHDRFHEPAFQQAFGNAKRLMHELAETLESGTMHIEPDSTIQRLHQQAESLAQFQCPSSRTVGFVGDSGVGKSSLLNSLLDCRGLARASNSGSACTCVATEYHYHNSDDFIVEVDLFTREEIINQLTDFVRSYRYFHEYKESMNDDEKENYEERASLARDTFRAMFRGRLTDEKLLIDRPEASVIETLTSWVDDLAPFDMPRRQVTSNLHACSVLLERLTSEQTEADSPAVWPYIEKIRQVILLFQISPCRPPNNCSVYLNAYILSKGLVLADLPGLRDLNTARRNITERHLLKCDDIFVICYIGRATTDVGVMSVFELAQKAKLTNVGIICTKSDDIRAEEAKKDWKGQKAREIQERIDVVQRHQRDIAQIKLELEDYDDYQDDLSDGERNEQAQLSRRLRMAESRLSNHDFELQRYLITSRNEIVELELMKQYQGRTPHGILNVFCVSNHVYWDHRDRPKSKALRHLDLSRILAIRQHCMAMVSESQFVIATKYMQNDISALLGDIELWVQSGSGSMTAERKQNIRNTLDVIEARLTRDLRGHTSENNNIGASSKNDFRSRITENSRDRITAWSGAARNASYEWSGWHHSTYSAFCQNYGNHYTAAAGSHNWNEEVIERMVRDLSPSWRGLRTSLDEQNDRITKLVEDLVDWAVQYLETQLQESYDSTAILGPTLISRRNLLVGDIEAAWNEFERNLDTLRTDALSGIRSSFIGKAMEGSYRACNHEGGTGSDARRKRIINDTVRRDTLFQQLLREFKQNFGMLVDQLQLAVQIAVSSHLECIRVTLDMVRSENIALESERDPAFRTRVEARVLATKAEMERVRAVLSS